jgi:hypothetical protein
MDEIFGYFPPQANPPSKQPMLTLLKQARSFGIAQRVRAMFAMQRSWPMP